jgi:hypothetical protein
VVTVTVTGLTAERMLEIEGMSVISGTVNGSGRLILTKHDGTTIDAGYVVGPKGDKGDPITVTVQDTATIDLTWSGSQALGYTLKADRAAPTTGLISFSSGYRSAILNARSPLTLTKEFDGYAHLRGMFENSTALPVNGGWNDYAQTVIGTLPAGFIPTKDYSKVIIWNSAGNFAKPAMLIVRGSSGTSEWVGTAGSIIFQASSGFVWAGGKPIGELSWSIDNFEWPVP